MSAGKSAAVVSADLTSAARQVGEVAVEVRGCLSPIGCYVTSRGAAATNLLVVKPLGAVGKAVGEAVAKGAGQVKAAWEAELEGATCAANL